MQPSRTMLLVASSLLVVGLLVGGLAVRVGADEGSFRQSVLFSEILSLILDNYVDPVEADGLLRGAYEGMLGGLDPNGAYLSDEEVGEWKAGKDDDAVGPGLSVLKVGSSVQVVAVQPDSPAEEAGVEMGDHIRRVADRAVRDLSLLQVRRLLAGAPGSTVTVELIRPGHDFEAETLELTRNAVSARAYTLDVGEQGIAVLEILSLGAVDLAELGEELDDVRSRGVEHLLLDLRNVADDDPRAAARVAGCFVEDGKLELRDVEGKLVETVNGSTGCAGWTGTTAVLVNGATAGGAEALAALVRTGSDAKVFGEKTYGLGAEPRLFELDGGGGLLLSAARWATPEGTSWNENGVEPDEVVEGEGTDWPEVREDQLRRVLELLSGEDEADEAAA